MRKIAEGMTVPARSEAVSRQISSCPQNGPRTRLAASASRYLSSLPRSLPGMYKRHGGGVVAGPDEESTVNWDLIIDPVLKEGAGKVFDYVINRLTTRDQTTIDLSGDEPISTILEASVTAKEALDSDPVLLRLQRVDPSATIDLFMIPTEKITVRLPRGTYVATALLLREPPTFVPTDKPVLIGLGRERVPVASSKTQRLRISIEAPSPKVLAELGSLADKFTVSRPSSLASLGTRQTVQRLLEDSTGPPPAPTGQVRLSDPEPQRVVRASGPEPRRLVRLSGSTPLDELRIRTSALNDPTSPLREGAARRIERQSMGCGARSRTERRCGKRVLEHGLCENHLRRAQLGRLVIWDSTGKPVQLPS